MRRALAAEGAIVVSLGVALTAASLGLLRLQYGVRFGRGDLLTAALAGLAAAAVVRAAVRLHRRWAAALGRFTAAAALCALAGLAGGLVAMIPGTCPGGIPGVGRCGVQGAAAWGQAAGLAALVNFLFAGFAVALVRTVRGVLIDAFAYVSGLRRAHAGRSRRA